MKTSAFLSALLTFFIIIAIISLCLLEVVVMRHRSEQPDTAMWLDHAEIPTVDNDWGAINLGLRKIAAMDTAEQIDNQYWRYRALYYQTGNDKYRLIANRFNIKYQIAWRIYKAKEDSLLNWTNIDTSK